jgi:hypothetical protein
MNGQKENPFFAAAGSSIQVEAAEPLPLSALSSVVRIRSRHIRQMVELKAVPVVW